MYQLTLGALREYVEGRDFSGWDPYDFLNSPFAPLLTLGSKYGRIAWTQLLRRSPVNLRPLLAIRKGHNPKGIGLFLRGYAKLYAATGDESCLVQCRRLLDILAACKSPGYSGNCWGYNFPWQSRVTYAPRYTPTIVNSSFIGHALLDCYESTGIEEARDMSLSISDFIVNDLNRKVEDGTVCFSYMPIDEDYVHNANVLGASLLMRLAAIVPDPDVLVLARSSIAYTMKHQNEDGSWYFADTAIQRWIDSFHTGFVLESLRHAIRLGQGNEWHTHFKKGVEFYAKNFFHPDGTAVYYHDGSGPLDIHCPAEALVFFSSQPGYEALAEQIQRSMVKSYWCAEGYFAHRKVFGTIRNRIPYMRWGQAWAFVAVAEYVHANSMREQ